MKREYFLLAVLFFLFAPSFALTLTPTQQEIQFDPRLIGQGRLMILTPNPQTCTFSNSDSLNQFNFTMGAPASNSALLFFTVSTPAVPFRDFIQVSCVENGNTVSNISLIYGNKVVVVNVTQEKPIPFFNSYSQPSPPQFDPNTLQYVNYPYFGFIGTGIGLDIFIATTVAIFAVAIFWKGLTS